MEVEMIPVNSAVIKALGYNEESRVCRVEFSTGRVFDYENMAPDVYAQFSGAASIGRYWHANVKGQYSFREVG